MIRTASTTTSMCILTSQMRHPRSCRSLHTWSATRRCRCRRTATRRHPSVSSSQLTSTRKKNAKKATTNRPWVSAQLRASSSTIAPKVVGRVTDQARAPRSQVASQICSRIAHTRRTQNRLGNQGPTSKASPTHSHRSASDALRSKIANKIRSSNR